MGVVAQLSRLSYATLRLSLHLHKQHSMDPSTLQDLASSVVLRQLPDMSTPLLVETLGPERVCDILAYFLQKKGADGRALVLKCMTRSRANELWQHLDTFSAESPTFMRLSRRTNIGIGVSLGDAIYCVHERGYPCQEIQSFGELTTACDRLKEAGVTDEEIQCIIGPMTAWMTVHYADSTRRG